MYLIEIMRIYNDLSFWFNSLNFFIIEVFCYLKLFFYIVIKYFN